MQVWMRTIWPAADGASFLSTPFMPSARSVTVSSSFVETLNHSVSPFA